MLRADSCRAATWDDLRHKAGRGRRTTVDDRGKQSRAKPDERRSVQTFEAEAPATRCSQRRTRVATDTAWRSSRPAWRQRPPHAQSARRGGERVVLSHTRPRAAREACGREHVGQHVNNASPWRTKAPHCEDGVCTALAGRD